MQVTTIGLAIAKSVFPVHGIDARGRVVLRRRLARGKVLTFFASLPRCLIGLEACGARRSAPTSGGRRWEPGAGAAAEHALRCGQEREPAGDPDAAPGARPADRPAHGDDPRTWTLGAAWPPGRARDRRGAASGRRAGADDRIRRGRRSPHATPGTGGAAAAGGPDSGARGQDRRSRPTADRDDAHRRDLPLADHGARHRPGDRHRLRRDRARGAGVPLGASSGGLAGPGPWPAPHRWQGASSRHQQTRRRLPAAPADPRGPEPWSGSAAAGRASSARRSAPTSGGRRWEPGAGSRACAHAGRSTSRSRRSPTSWRGSSG